MIIKRIFFSLTFILIGCESSHEKNAVDKLFSEWNKSDSPGGSFAVIKNGDVLYKGGFGYGNLDYDYPNASNSVFYLASVSKQFTAMAMALLEEQGKISLDDDIRKYFPEIPDYGSKIIIRNLIHHNSGLRDYLNLWSLKGRSYADSMDEQEIINLIARQKELNFNPGDEYMYSNSGYFLMAVLVKRVTGMSIRDYTNQYFFQPLEMNNTHFHDNRDMIVKNRADSYVVNDSILERVQNSFDLVGSGGLLSNIDDLILWDKNYYSNKIGSGKKLMETIRTKGILNNGDTLDYAFGLVHSEYKGLKTIGHSGGMFGYRTHMLRFPDQRFSVIILSNLFSMKPGNLAKKISDIYLADILADPDFETNEEEVSTSELDETDFRMDNEQLSKFSGTFFSPELETSYHFNMKKDTLTCQVRYLDSVSLNPTGPFTFKKDKWITLEFENNYNGFTLNTGRTKNIKFKRIKN
ncbi:MAG: serine hydrolase domain-containing protein [Candidatus Marinimicrobia bacterium]|nr:serine hydrolase domain-containing protein [Candidatus Neomarinimicrobiota bacterium]